MSLFFSLFLIRELHEISLYEGIYISVHNGIDVRGLVVGSMVFDTSIIEYVRTDLAPPLDLLLSRLYFRLRLTTFLEFEFIQLRAQSRYSQ